MYVCIFSIKIVFYLGGERMITIYTNWIWCGVGVLYLFSKYKILVTFILLNKLS